jgi:MAP/microtubule affinity-regulating kinase
MTNESFKSFEDQISPAYALGRQIGKGGYAIVRQGVHRESKKEVAVKVYEKCRLIDQRKKDRVRREIKVMKKLEHCHVIKFIESFETSKQIHIVMELVRGPSLLNYLRKQPAHKLTEAEAKRLFRQMLLGIQQCHLNEVAHRDLKLENLLLDEHFNIRIIDFGFATCQPGGKKAKLFCGTPSYMAPEIVSKKEYSGQPADVWALGVLLFTMLTGKLPFRGMSNADLYRKIQRGMFSVPAEVSSEPKLIIQRMLATDPALRPTVTAVLKTNWVESDAYDEEKPPNLSRQSEIVRQQRDPAIIQSLVELNLGYTQSELAAQLDDPLSFTSVLYTRLKSIPDMPSIKRGKLAGYRS